MTDLISIILPVQNQVDHIRSVIGGHVEALDRLGRPYEILLVPNGCTDRTPDACRELAAANVRIRVVEPEKRGWGAAVRAGLSQAKGDLLCFANSARTSSKELLLTVLYATVFPDIVVKANRKIREHWTRRLGSLLFNLEARALFDLSYWDINGTPKVFPSSFHALRDLSRDDDLIDLEFLAICRRDGYSVIEVPTFSTRRHGGRSTTNLRTAVRLYWGAFRLRGLIQRQRVTSRA